MHPQVRLPEFGPCPQCGMDLVAAEVTDAGPRQLVLSPAAVELAGVETATVTRRFVTRAIRMIGKVDYDETRVRTIAARVAGRLDRLFVDYTGVPVQEGDHLVWLYSPDLLAAQQELLEARKRLAVTSAEPSEFLAESNRRGYQAARDKLRLWGLSAAQVDEIETRGTAEDHLMIQSPSSGVVIQRNLHPGDYVQEGTPIYRIADLSRVWVRLDAYEQDLPWLRYGQDVAVQAEALPGDTFRGKISFLDPVLDEKTRTVKVRVHLDNPDGRLKPGMFVRAVVEAQLGAGGRVVGPSLAGKWISPMHPEVIKDGPGPCDVCGMDLVPAEELGLGAAGEGEAPLVVPAGAVLLTGTRAVVYVEVPGAPEPTYEGREVVLGPRAGDHYLVRSGLREHERVVARGAFRIDSSMQIQARPSMMSQRGEEGTHRGPDMAPLRVAQAPVWAAYLDLAEALAADDDEGAAGAAALLEEAVEGLPVSAPRAAAQPRWQELGAALREQAAAVHHAPDRARRRAALAPLSETLRELERAFGHAGATLYEAYCPMARDDQGALWLQRERRIANPYFGATMLRCGEIRAELPGVDG